MHTSEYTFVATLDGSFDDVIEQVTEALKEEGFGVLTEIDVKETLREKLDVDFPPYRILGACNPPLAHQALQTEPRIGAMLPCNVIVRQVGNQHIEVAAIDPVASMAAIDNDALEGIAQDVRGRLKRIVEGL